MISPALLGVLLISFRLDSTVQYDSHATLRNYRNAQEVIRFSVAWVTEETASLPLYGNSSWPKDVIITLSFCVFRIRTQLMMLCTETTRMNSSKNI